jgi:integrase
LAPWSICSSKKARTTQPTTTAWYRRILTQHALPVIGTLRASCLTTTHIRRLVDGARNSPRTPQRGERLGPITERNLIVAIRALLAWGVAEGLLRTNVANKVALPAESHVEQPIVGVDDVRALIDAARGTQLATIVPVALGTGLHRAELCPSR